VDAGGTGAATAATASSRRLPDEALGAFEKVPVQAAVRAQAALKEALAARKVDGAAYLAFRKAVACGEPFFRQRGFLAEALLGGGPSDETGGPLGRLDAAMAAGDAAGIASNGADVDRALQLIEDSFRRTPMLRDKTHLLLPRTAYELGAILAGSKPGLATTAAGAVADAAGALEAIEGMVAGFAAEVSPGQDFAAQMDRVRGHVEALKQAIGAAEAAGAAGELSDRAALIARTGKLGAALREVLSSGAKGAGSAGAVASAVKPWRPYAPLVPAAGGGPEEPSSVLTVPRLSRMSHPASEEEQRKLAALGEKLFSDKTLSKGHVRSCATCHVPEKAYTDGKAHPDSLDASLPLVRNTPTLLYSPMHAAQFWDGRELTFKMQALVVMHSRPEMGDAQDAFPRPSFASAEDAAAALGAFEQWRLSPADAPIDRFARGDEQALSAEDRRGFDVFAGKGRCARCHVPPLFGGSYPTDFSTAVYAALGVPESPSKKTLDPDRGRGAVTRLEKDMFAFKTPTLRNAARTAPYFHNGSFATLESVVDFYDKGGGKGMGLDVPTQDPEVRPLHLTAAERSALLRFLRVALTDGPRAP
jgi:cytochrome c peroxidase